MADVERISAEAARRKVQDGSAVLVCAYEDEGKCASMKLEGALTPREFRGTLPSLSKDRELIFYCA